MSRSSNETPDEPPGSVELTETDRHRILAAEHRRMALDLLESRTAPIGLRELARGIVAREDGTASPENELVERVAIGLHHRHLPMMADLGVIDYDPASKHVEPTGCRPIS